MTGKTTDVQHTRLTSENEYFTRLEHIYLTSTIRSLVAPHFDHRTTRDPPHLPQRVYRSVQNVTALSTAPGQVYMNHRAVPTSQIPRNIENIDRENVAPSTGRYRTISQHCNVALPQCHTTQLLLSRNIAKPSQTCSIALL